MAVSLPNARIKIDRAKYHFAELEAEIGAYHARNPYRIVIDTESEPGEKLCRFEFVEPIPAHLGGIIGDVVHNLRAALDNLAVDLVKAIGKDSKTAVSETYFPIGTTEESFEDSLNSRFRRASDNAKRIVRRLKPYQSGRGAFWQLHQLDILDKHTSIVPVGIGGGKMGFRPKPPPFILLREAPPEGIDPVELPIMWFNLVARYPLKHGEVIAHAPKSVASVILGPPDMPQFNLPVPPDPEFQFAVHIAFGEGQVVDGEPVIPTIKQFIDFIERVVEIFEKYGP